MESTLAFVRGRWGGVRGYRGRGVGLARWEVEAIHANLTTAAQP